METAFEIIGVVNLIAALALALIICGIEEAEVKEDLQ
jgi:hypothetical protein